MTATTLHRLSAVLACLISTIAIGAAPKEFQIFLEDAKKETSNKEFSTADDTLSKAIRFARGTNNPDLEVQATLERALNLRAWHATGKATEKAKKDLVDNYTIVIGIGKGPQRDLACNNLAVWHLQQNHVDEALGVFARAGEPTSDAAAFYTNYGRALEIAKKPGEALKKYRLAVDREPNYARAVQSIAKVLVTHRDLPRRIDEAQWLLQKYDTNDPDGRQALMVPLLLELLPNWNDVDELRKLLPFLASYLARSRVDAASFHNLISAGKKAEGMDKFGTPPGELFPLTQHDNTKGAIKELEAIYLSDAFASRAASPILKEEEVRQALPIWKGVIDKDFRTQKSLATLLTLAGDAFHRRGMDLKGKEPSRALVLQALRRFTAAFALDNSASAPALAAVNLLTIHARSIDSDGTLLSKYAESLFNQKKDLLVKANSRDDHIRLLGLHMALAAIFQEQNRWTTGKDPNDQRNAVFQWEAAIKDEANIRKEDPTYPVSPDLRYRLAEAHLKSKRGEQVAPQFYLEAAELYLEQGNPASSQKVLRYAQELAAKRAIRFSKDQDPTRLSGVAERSEKAALRWEFTQPAAVEAIALSDTADRLVILGKTRLTAFNLSGAKPVPINPVEGYPRQGNGLDWLKGTKSFVIGRGNALEVWDAERFVPPNKPLVSHQGLVRDLVVNETDGNLIASYTYQGETKITSARSGEVLRTFQASKPAPSRIALSADGKFLIVGHEKLVTIWDVKNGERLFHLEIEGSVTCIGISSDGKLLAAGTLEGTIQCWDFNSRKPLGTLTGGKDKILGIRFPPRGTALAAVDERIVRLWDVKEGVELARFGASIPPLSANFSTDGKTLAVGCGREKELGLIRVWDVSSLIRE